MALYQHKSFCFVCVLCLSLCFVTTANAGSVEVRNVVSAYSYTGGQTQDGEDGEDGQPGKDGRSGSHGQSSVSGDGSAVVRIESSVNGETFIEETIYQNGVAVVTHSSSSSDVDLSETRLDQDRSQALVRLAELMAQIRLILLRYGFSLQ